MLRHSIQDWLHVGRRTGDDTQDLTRRSLLLQRFLEGSWNRSKLTFSIAITAWSAKVSRSLIWAGVNGTNLGSTCVQVPIEFSLLSEGERPTCVGAP